MSDYTVGPTTCVKDHWGKWHAKTKVVFPEIILDSMKKHGQRVINLSTYRNDRGVLVTTANAALSGDGWETSVLGLGGGGDFSKRVAQDASLKRVLEKDIRRQHEAAVAQIPALAAEVIAYYANTKVDA